MKPRSASTSTAVIGSLTLCVAIVLGVQYGTRLLTTHYRLKQYRRQVLTHLAQPLIHDVNIRHRTLQEAFERWSRFATFHPDILRAGLFDLESDALQVYPASPANRQWYQKPESLAPFEVIKVPVFLRAGASPARELAVVIRPHTTLFNPVSAPVPFWPAALAGALIIVPVAWWWRRRIQQLLRRFLCRAHTTLGEFAPHTPNESPQIEMERLLDHIDALRRDAVYWRTQADQLQRIMDNKVQAEKRQLNTLLERTRKIAGTDALTGMANRSQLQARLPELFAQQQRAGGELSIVMIDIDHFKQLNDTLGHRAGDALLRFVGQLIRTQVREQDLAIRYGGDEFLLALPDLDCKQAGYIAGRIAAFIEQHCRYLAVSPRPTVSVGIAARRHHRQFTLDELVTLADEALYQAKRRGRNTVHIATCSVTRKQVLQSKDHRAAHSRPE